MNSHFWKSKVLIAVVLGLFSVMVFAETMPSTESLYSRLMKQGKELYGSGEFDQAAAKYQSALDAAANEGEMAGAYFLLALTYYARVDMENCQSSLDDYFSVAAAGANPLLGKELPSRFVELFKSQKKEYLQKTAETVAPSAQVKKEEPQPRPTVREQETIAPPVKKKKKFPWLLVIAVTLIAGAAIYYFVVINKKYTLTTNVGTGVDGTPATGSVKYKNGSVINYEFYPVTGYTNLVVTLDGTPVANRGTVTMDKNHTLSASATECFYLMVTKNAGVNGTPEMGTYTYFRNDVVNYSYSYAYSSGPYMLEVKLDGAVVAASGTVTMDKNHTLSADLVLQYTLTVSKGTGVNGTPETGSYLYRIGHFVSYSYTLQSGFTGLEVKIDGIAAPASGTITMDFHHVLMASSTSSQICTLTVKIYQDISSGYPATGTYYFAKGTSVNYSYTAGINEVPGVSIDGIYENCPHNLGSTCSGVIIMDHDHYLEAAGY